MFEKNPKTEQMCGFPLIRPLNRAAANTRIRVKDFQIIFQKPLTNKSACAIIISAGEERDRDTPRRGYESRNNPHSHQKLCPSRE